MAKPIVISILADAAGVGKGVGEAEGYLGRLGTKAGKVAKAVGVATVATGVAIVGISTTAASEAEQSIGATESVFGAYADTVISKSKQAAQTVGLSANSYRELANVSAAMLKSSGIPMDQLAGKTDTLITRAADLAATFGGPTSDAVSAVGALLRGEADPIERYGISIKQSDVNARLAAEGLDGLTGEALKAASAEARLALLMEQSASSAGQFASEINTLEGQKQRFTAQVDNAKVAIGERFLPVATAAFGWLNQYAPVALGAVETGLNRLSPVFDAAVSGITGLASTFGPALATALPHIGTVATAVGAFAVELGQNLAPAIGTVVGWIGDYGPTAFGLLASAVSALSPVVSGLADIALGLASALSGVIGFMDQNRAVVGVLIGGYVAYRAILITTTAAGWAMYLWQSRAVIMGATQIAVTKGITAAQLLLNKALKANPLGLVITGITLLVGGIMLAWKHSETFRKVVTGAFNAVVSAGRAMWDGITSAVQWIGNAIGAAVGLVQGYIGLWVAAFGLVIDAGQALWSGVTSAVGLIVDGVMVYVGLVQKYIGLWVSAFKGLVNYALGMPAAIGGAISNVVGHVTGLKNKVTGALSGAGSWLIGVGEDIMRGVRDGIDNGLDWVKSKLSGLGKLIPGWLKSVLGISSPSRVMRDQVGQWVPRGVAAGIDTGTGPLRTSVVAMADDAISTAQKAFDSTALAPRFDLTGTATAKAKASAFDPFALSGGAPGTAGSGARVYNITVQAVAPNAEVGRAVVDAIRDYERLGGVR